MPTARKPTGAQKLVNGIKLQPVTVGVLVALLIAAASLIGFYLKAEGTVKSIVSETVQHHSREDIALAHPPLGKRLDKINDRLDQQTRILIRIERRHRNGP